MFLSTSLIWGDFGSVPSCLFFAPQNPFTFRWATGSKNMGPSSQYPMWLGRTFAWAYDLLVSGRENELRRKPTEFINRVIKNLAPPGTLSEEVGR